MGVLEAGFGLSLDIFGFWRFQGPDFRALGADFDLIVELSWVLGAIFGVWIGPGTWGPIWKIPRASQATSMKKQKMYVRSR